MIIQETFVVFYSEQIEVWRNSEGQPHRLGGPAVIDLDGTQEWFLHGERHRDDGPAVIRSDGYQAWFKHGQCHRLGDPSIIYPDGSKAWHVDGKPVTQEEVEK